MSAPKDGIGQVLSSERTVVVGVDGSPASQWALQWAADEAVRRDAVLRVVHAGHGRRATRPEDDLEGARILSEATDLATDRQPLVSVRVVRTSEAPGRALVEASALADLLVVGASSKLLSELSLGSVSEHCLRHAACPVVVVSHPLAPGGPDPAAPGQIVVGFDGSPGGDRALRWALAEAVPLGASVLALFGWQYPPVGSLIPGPVEGYRARAREVLETALAHGAQWQPTVTLYAEERFGPPVEVLLGAARSAVLLVIGARDHHDHHALLGSLAHQCARQCPCPLVVVRGMSQQPVDRASDARGGVSSPGPAAR